MSPVCSDSVVVIVVQTRETPTLRLRGSELTGSCMLSLGCPLTVLQC